jgi:outer membrane murein-binding lipoprotein Lpp
MFFRYSLIAVALASALLAGCGKDEPASTTAPAEKIVAQAPATASSALEAQVKAFRNNDLKALVAAALPAKELERIRADWDKQRAEPITDEERAEFAESWGKITGADGVDKIMAEVEPQLAELKPQLAGIVAMGQGMATMSIQQSTELTADQKTQATQFMNGLGGWLGKTDFADAALMRKALTALADGLRATGITKLDDIKALSFDEMLVKAGPAMGGVKNALAAYGFSLDAISDSVKAEVISETGDVAKLKVSYSLFNSPLSFESEMKKVDGKWYGKDMLEQIDKAKADAANANANADDADASDDSSDDGSDDSSEDDASDE